MHASARPEEAPRVIGRYRVFHPLASGGMATVHLGHMEGSAGFSRIVAIKRMKPEIARQADFAAMFRDEAMIAARVQHPNVVTTIDVVSEDDELFIVMEYVRGLALKELMHLSLDRDERIPVDIALSIIGGTLEGLHAAHNVRGEHDEPLDLVHRDVSPHNILVGRDGVVRIVDFGVAKAASRMHQTGANQVKGKLTYMAPERITSKEADRRVDVFSAGVVLWEVLAGRKRYEGSSVQEIASELLTTDAPPLADERSDVPPALDAVIRRATARDPDERYATAEEMLTDLEGIGAFATKRAVSAWVEEIGSDVLEEHDELTRALRAHIAGGIPAPRDSASERERPPSSGITTLNEPTFTPLERQRTAETRVIPELAAEPVAPPPEAPPPVVAPPAPVVRTVPVRVNDLRTQVMTKAAPEPPPPDPDPPTLDNEEDVETRLIRPPSADEDLETRLIRHPSAADEDLETRLIRPGAALARRAPAPVLQVPPAAESASGLRAAPAAAPARPSRASPRSSRMLVIAGLLSLAVTVAITVLALRGCAP